MWHEGEGKAVGGFYRFFKAISCGWVPVCGPGKGGESLVRAPGSRSWAAGRQPSGEVPQAIGEIGACTNGNSGKSMTG
jgi:hypothetical protein